PDAHAGPRAEMLRTVHHAAAPPVGADGGHAAAQAGPAHRAPEGLEAAEDGAAAREVAQAGEGRESARPCPGGGGRGRAADLALRVTRALVVVNPAAGGGRTARAWRRLRDVLAATLPAEHAETRG